MQSHVIQEWNKSDMQQRAYISKSLDMLQASSLSQGAMY